MEGKGGCCIARYATGTYEMSTVDRIMLKYRPIAPKPGTVSDGSSSESAAADVFSRSGGTRRKHAKDNSGNKRCNRRRKTVPPPPAVTLPLLPETPDPKEPPKSKIRNDAVWLSFEEHVHASPVKVNLAAVGLRGSVVAVESVTDTWQGEGEGEWLGRREDEVKLKLEGDTCPGFISDGYGRVTWTNRAYKEMVGEGGVRLAMKVRVPYPPYQWFTCRVKVQYACGKERIVPCDVCRIDDSGGFAWRLDVTAALTLSLAL